MNNIRFTWDDSKASLNKRKHGISFDEAQTVFYDENAIEYFDPDHSEDEDRFIMLGFSFKLRICLLYTSPSPRDGLLSRMPSSA